MNVELLLTAAPVVVGLVEVAKRGGLPTRWAGVAALICGVAVALLLAAPGRETVLVGIGAGLAASGLYSQAVTLRGGKPSDQSTE